ncbi:MAG: metal ABC transporter substrate-binding protein [Desulfobacteraceae bacterium]|jgi:zinc transport system substrate-binding protein
MKKWFIQILFILLIAASANADTAKGQKIVAGTTFLSDIIKDIAGPDAEIRTVIPGGACPGHYDVKPGDLKLLAESDFLFLHSWQKGHQNMNSIIRAAENKALKIVIVAGKDNTMIPKVHCQVIEIITEHLKKLNPEKSREYTAAAEKRINRVKAVEIEVTELLKKAGVDKTPVICATMQKGFIMWAGFHVIADYGRPEDLTPDKVANIISKARNAGVKLVVDNLQSGPDAGKGIAQDLGVPQVNLSNFPDAFKGIDTWEKNIHNNVNLLIKALSNN